MTEGVPVSIFTGIMDVLSEEYGERMCGEAFNVMIEALCKVIAWYERRTFEDAT